MIKFLAALIAALLLPLAACAQGGVVVSADPRATDAGLEMLRAGGSATDAAMAMMLALTVVEPQSSGIGGGGFLLHHNGKTGAIDTVDGRETAPASATPERFLGPDGKPMPFFTAVQGGLSVGVPGNVRLMALAHARWGKLPWKTLFEPAIKLAEDGFEVTPPLAATIKFLAPVWREKFPRAAELYLDRDDQPVPVGTRIYSPELGHFLRQIAELGPEIFYTGEYADKIVDTVGSLNPGGMTMDDLRSYEAKQRPAVCGGYRHFVVCGMGPPSSGATTVLQILGMIERFDLKKLGPNSPEAWHVIGEAMQLAYADREKYLGDSDFVSVPVPGLIDPEYLKERSKLISAKKSRTDYPAGTPPGAPPRTPGNQNEVPGTTHFVAIDREGNIASMTSTVEGPFGSQLLMSGMVLNNELTDFSFAPEKDGAPVANRVEPGKRPLSSMSPTIVYDPSGKPVIALGSAGGKRIIMHVLKTLVGMIDWDLAAPDAMALPNLYYDRTGLMIEANEAGNALVPGLVALGPARAADLPSKLTVIVRTSLGWQGAADPRSVGTAASE